LPVLVSDTSVIIDLERGGFLEDLFRLPYEFAVPDLLFDRELKGALGDQLIALGMRVEDLTPAELSRAIEVRRARTELSTPDAFAFAIAEERGWLLLTGDSGLRRLADDEGITFHGLLWLCDQFEAGAVVAANRLHGGLSAISNHPRCRLPTDEVNIRLRRYAGG
jgi:predicted nucleic acid-binding protein